VTDPPLSVFLPYGPGAASARVRVYEWLARTQVPATVHSYVGRVDARPQTLATHPLATLAAEVRLRRRSRRPSEHVLLHVEASPLSAGGVERSILAGARFSSFDIDDGYPWDWGDDRLYRRWRPKAAKAILAIGAVDRVIAGNDLLAEWAAAFAREVVVVPSCVDPADYARKERYEAADPPRLGWIGSPATEAFLAPLADALLEVNRRTGARLTVVSRGTASLGPLDEVVDRVKWSPRRAASVLADFDVGIMPLPGGLYDRAKCGYKLLQYAASGLPAVASPVGVNSDLLNRFGAPAPLGSSDWVDSLLCLLEASAETRAAAGARARAVVADQYSYDAWADRWLAAIRPG
jgi:glycosyltransferase involved in cell wall biosynthesis